MQQERYGLFAVADSVGFELTYLIPQAIGELPVGSLCVVPVRNMKRVGVFLGETEAPAMVCKPIMSVLPYTRPFSPLHLQLARWLSDYYLAPLGRTIRLLAPGFVWDPKKMEAREKRFSKKLTRDSQGENSLKFDASIRGEIDIGAVQHIELRPDQQRSIDEIFSDDLSVTLLHGVTGSGKTEVYIQAAEKVLSQGKNVLMLVPEIALTPQMGARFRKAFGPQLGILHSGLTAVEYEREWFRAHYQECKILLGVRSAVFSPITDLGLIIVDEEHDGGYKCDEFPCYHARDVAVKRAALEGARCILGSATPSLESFYNVELGRYRYSQLKERALGSLPEIKVTDARPELAATKKRPQRSSLVHFKENVIAESVVEMLAENKKKGEQSMVILNRRGYANFAMCSTCGNALRCPKCSVTTTLHKHGAVEICHYCGFQRKTATSCQDCGGTELLAMGAGTQNIESELSRLLPDLRIGRLDRDVLTSNTRLTELLQGFRNGEIDCLVGTQILAKGHDFSRVTLVAILHVEDGLFLPDFRSGERTFQLLTQAAGRAGRGELRGTVVLQTLIPGQPVVELALKNDVDGFLKRELQTRRLGWHPPVSRQILIEFSAKNEGKALSLGNRFRQAVVENWQAQGLSPNDVRLVGPYPAALERLKETYRYQICVTAQKSVHPRKLIPPQLLAAKEFQGVIRCDVDPYSFL